MRMRTAFIALIGGRLASFCGCGGSGGGDGGDGGAADGAGPAIDFVALEPHGTTASPLAVQVNGVADQDGSLDEAWRVRIELGEHGLSPDPQESGEIGGGLLHCEAFDEGTLSDELLIDVVIHP